MTTQTPKPQPAAATPVPVAAGQTGRQDFGGQELAVSGETASTALATQARAMVEARFIMAMRRPRDMDDVRQKLLAACERPGFAGHATEKVWGAAWYRKPVGDGVEGFSVRFAEEAVRALGNVDVEPAVIYEDDRKRIVNVSVIDLETNNSYRSSIVVEKTVERKFLKKGQQAIRTRVNSYNEVVHLVEATDDEVYAKQNALISKVMRNAVLKLLPGDIQAECRTRILEIRMGDAATDPGKVRREVSDAFAGLNVMPSELKKYLGHELGVATPAELTDLRELYKAIKAGSMTWVDALAAALEEQGVEQPPATNGATPKPGLDGLTEKLQQKAAAAAPAPADQPIEKVDPKECGHRPILEQLASTPVGTAISCPACDTDVEGTMTPDQVKAAVQAVAGAATPEPVKGNKPRQNRLPE